jgi:catechol 2,3-dioxygenase-like lactoylglutathione lyase family enzyme
VNPFFLVLPASPILRITGGALRFNHVTIVVADLERSKEFYSKLGLIQIVDTPPRYARFRAPDGDATISVEVDPEVLGDPGAVQLFFECPDIDEMVANLKAKGLSFYQEPTDMFYLWREARLRDPDGHDIRLYRESEPDVRLNPPWKIKHD